MLENYEVILLTLIWKVSFKSQYHAKNVVTHHPIFKILGALYWGSSGLQKFNILSF